MASCRQVRLSTFGWVREAGFALLATFDHPHFTMVLADLRELTLARLDRCFDEPIPNPGRPSEGSVGHHERSVAVDDTYEIAIDFMDMIDDRHLWARAGDGRPGVDFSVGRHVIVGDDDADPKVARIIAVDADGDIDLEVLPGSVESHADLLTLA